MSGRISEIEVYNKDPRIFYVGTASGGIWKTTSGGVTFTPLFQKEGSASIGAVAVDQNNPDNVWVGTGEDCSRNSSSWGDGIYHSIDGGKTWKNMGLNDSKHISRIVLDPKNSKTLYVGALGHLWGPSSVRGVFKSTDEGKTWQHVLKLDDRTGIIDLKMNPSNPNEMLAASYQRERKPWQFASGGPGSALYKTTDGGKTWKKITKGLPTGMLGRIGLSYFLKDPKVIVAQVESEVPTQGTPLIRNDAGGVYRSTDGGESWSKVGTLNVRPFYFSCPVQDPQNVDRLYAGGVQLYVSNNQGKEFKTIGNRLHSDHHTIWVNPNNNQHIIEGNDGGVAQSWDAGETWQVFTQLRIGQFYAVSFDFRKPYYVYGGLQDNGCWGGPTQTKNVGVRFTDWYMLGGGDGFHMQADPNDWTTVYGESQNGGLYRVDQRTGQQANARPRGENGERLRFNWSTPIVLSPHNSSIVYVGTNKLYRSLDRGDHYYPISPDLSTNDSTKQNARAGVTPEDTGAERHCTIITVSESPVKPGVIWAGTDDGNVQVTQDDGKTWVNVVGNIAGVPKNTWCSRVTASKYSVGRAYVCFDGHRFDDYKPYVFVTEDFGKTWTRLAESLPEGNSCYVIREGTQNPDFLLLGTEMSLYMSLDRGQNWTKFTSGDWPTVAVHDVQIHPRELDAIVGTHGRAIWTIPVGAMEQLTASALKDPVTLCKPANAYLLGFVASQWFGGDYDWAATNTQPRATFFFFLKEEAKEDPTITVTNAQGDSIAVLPCSKAQGLQRQDWRLLSSRGGSVSPGNYNVKLSVDGKSYQTTLTVEDASSFIYGWPIRQPKSTGAGTESEIPSSSK